MTAKEIDEGARSMKAFFKISLTVPVLLSGCITSVRYHQFRSERHQDQVHAPIPEFETRPLQEAEELPPEPNEMQLDPVPPQPSAASNRLLPTWRARAVSTTRSKNRTEKNLFD